MASMGPPDDVPAQLATLVVRVAEGQAARTLAADAFDLVAEPCGGFTLARADVVVWLGDVVAPHDRPLAAAVVRLGDEAVVRAATVEVGPLADRLAERLALGIVEVASAHGCATITATTGGPGDPGPDALMVRSGLACVERRVWLIEP